MKIRLGVVMVWCVIMVAGCGRSEKAAAPAVNATVEAEDQGSSFNPFLVFKDKGTRENHFVPSGFMPNGNCLTISDVWQAGCYEGSSCIKIVYDTECSQNDAGWAGIFWLNPANNWGSRKGGFDLTGAQKLTFWARGEQGGERIEEISIGGVSGDFPDTDSAMIGPVILTKEWREYTIDLRGKDLSYISGGFSWTTNAKVNPSGCTFYLDDIRYE